MKGYASDGTALAAVAAAGRDIPGDTDTDIEGDDDEDDVEVLRGSIENFESTERVVKNRMSLFEIMAPESIAKLESPWERRLAKLFVISGNPTHPNIYVVSLLLSTILGPGVLNQPEVFQLSGLGGAFLSMFTCAAFMWLSLQLLIDCGTRFKKMDYSELAKEAFGIRGEIAVDVLIVLNNLGGILSYLVMFGGTLTELADAWGCSAHGCNVNLMTLVATIAIVIPLSLMRYFGNLNHQSIFCIFTMGVIIVGIIISVSTTTDTVERVKAFTGSNGLRKFGSIIYYLTCATTSFHAYNSMSTQTEKDWRKVSFSAITLGLFAAFAVGISASVCFGDATSGDVFENVASEVANPLQFILLIHLVFYIPAYFVVLRHSFVRLCGRKDGQFPATLHLIFTICGLIFLSVIALAIRAAGLSKGEAFGIILDLTGGIAGTMINFIFPSLIYIKLMSQNNNYPLFYVLAKLMLVFGVFVFFLVPTMSIIYESK